VRLLLALEKPETAVPLLSLLVTSAEQTGRRGSLVEILLLQSLCLHTQGQAAPALSALSDALSIAEGGGYVRLFADEGAVIVGLLRQLPEGSYRDTLLTHFPPALAGDQELDAPLPVPQALRDPLTERELDVLRLMTSHLSGPSIARELHISINTYKSHIKNIYGKLGVRSREDAVARAQALKLI
jgi:LuxR family maltose regulon positive regulatory protein